MFPFCAVIGFSNMNYQGYGILTLYAKRDQKEIFQLWNKFTKNKNLKALKPILLKIGTSRSFLVKRLKVVLLKLKAEIESLLLAKVFFLFRAEN